MSDEVDLHFRSDIVSGPPKLNLQDGDDPCPFCAWGANMKAKVSAVLMVTKCPCSWRNASDRETMLDIVVHFFAEDLRKRLK